MRDIYDVTNDLFIVFEQMRTLFRNWTKESPDVFMEGMLKFRALEKDLEQVVGDEENAHTIIQGIYLSVFPQATQNRDATVLRSSRWVR